MKIDPAEVDTSIPGPPTMADMLGTLMLMVFPLLASVTFDPAARLVNVGPLTTTDPLDATTDTPPRPTTGAELNVVGPLTTTEPLDVMTEIPPLPTIGAEEPPVTLTSMAVGKVRVAW
jgi:hypothetical protein